MKSILGTLLKIFALSTAVCVVIFIFADWLGFSDSDKFSYSNIAFDLSFIYGYFRFQKSSFGLTTVPALFGSNLPRELFLGIVASVCIFLWIMLCVSIFHGKITFSEKYVWSNLSPVVLVTTAAAMEETLFRGFIVSTLRTKLAFRNAVSLSAILFACLHFASSFQVIHFIFYFTFATSLSVVTMRFQSLLPGIVYHSISNYCIGLTSLGLEGNFAHSGIFRFQNGSPWFVYMVSTIITGIAIILIILFFDKRLTTRLGNPNSLDKSLGTHTKNQ